ncbi:MAG: hypothetical protein ACLUQ6_06035 [Alistipes onderdonkii]
MPEAGLALSISQSNNTFERGDIVEVSLSDASAQLFSGLLQVSTHNEPMLVGQTEPLAPIAVTADKIAEYESQYVKIENTQPEASESGTWKQRLEQGQCFHGDQGRKVLAKSAPCKPHPMHRMPS